MRVLVTGANGFVGSSLGEAILNRGMGLVAAVRRQPISPARPDAQYHVVGEIDDDTDWTKALSGVDVVVHLAARVHVMEEHRQDPLQQYRAVNTAGTLNLARQAAAAGIRRFIFMSSVKVNGEGQPDAYSEAQTPCPADAYAISKLEAEQGLRDIATRTGMEVVILRPPLVYGPGVGANFLRLLRAVDRGWPLPFGAVCNRRGLIYVGNLVDAILTCLIHPRAANKTYLVSDGEDVSTSELIRRMARALGRPARLIRVPAGILRLAGRLVGRAQAVDRLLGSLSVDSGAIRRELGWFPPFSMQQGLEETANWYHGTHG